MFESCLAFLLCVQQLAPGAFYSHLPVVLDLGSMPWQGSFIPLSSPSPEGRVRPRVDSHQFLLKQWGTDPVREWFCPSKAIFLSSPWGLWTDPAFLYLAVHLKAERVCMGTKEILFINYLTPLKGQSGPVQRVYYYHWFHPAPRSRRLRWRSSGSSCASNSSWGKQESSPCECHTFLRIGVFHTN